MRSKPLLFTCCFFFSLCILNVFVYLNQELAAVSVELPDVLKSLQLCKLKENEVIFLKDVKKTLAKSYVMKHQVKILYILACLNYRSILFGLIKSLVISHLVLLLVLGNSNVVVL